MKKRTPERPERKPYVKPALERRGNLRKITLTSFTPPPPPDR